MITPPLECTRLTITNVSNITKNIFIIPFIVPVRLKPVNELFQLDDIGQSETGSEKKSNVNSKYEIRHYFFCRNDANLFQLLNGCKSEQVRKLLSDGLEKKVGAILPQALKEVNPPLMSLNKLCNQTFRLNLQR